MKVNFAHNVPAGSAAFAVPASHDEGVIKFHAEHTSIRLVGDDVHSAVSVLGAWREILHGTGLVGQDRTRYGGAGFGNVSCRLPPHPGERGRRRFLITCTQTGGAAALAVTDYCVVEAYDAAANRVQSRGPCMPSSESLTHGAVYDLSPAIRFVFHAHSPDIWKAAAPLRLPTTAPQVAYGTPEMAREVGRLFRASALPDVGVFVMAGHEDGVVTFGRCADDAGATMMRTLAHALALGQSTSRR